MSVARAGDVLIRFARFVAKVFKRVSTCFARRPLIMQAGGNWCVMFNYGG